LPLPLGLIPIVALTASAFSDDVSACLAAGMDACSTKPIWPDRLREVIDDMLTCRAPAMAADA
jgi:CheY-like chemotaxis protein